MSSEASNPAKNPAGPSADSVRQQLGRLLADPRFIRAGRLSKLLRFTVEKTLSGARDEIKEYLIALDVYDRPPSYDPAVDSLVRVEMSRLRAKLTDYYSTVGAGDAVRIEYPKGQYAPVFVCRDLPCETPHEVAPQPRRRMWIWLTAAIVIAAA